MSDEKPLHVRVAEALGWRECAPQTWLISGETYVNDRNWVGWPPSGRWVSRPSVYRYDTDWSATGPLIERFGIMVEPDHPDDLGRSGFKGWYALREHDTPILDATGATPLEAVCRLILALAEAGKLSA